MIIVPALNDLELTRNLISRGPDDLIELYTLQSGDAFTRLMVDGVLRTEPRYAFPEDMVSPGKAFAYDWICEQAAKRLPAEMWPRGTLPLWCSLKPYPDYALPTDFMLTLRIPKRRLLPHFYAGWTQLLDIGSRFDGRRWPSYWFPGRSPVMNPFYERPPPFEPVEATPPTPPETTCRESWETMFDLEQVNCNGFQWEPTVHVVTAFIGRHDLISHIDLANEKST